MADPEQLAILKRGVAEWNAWRQKFPDTKTDLVAANVSGANLSGFDLNGADLSGATLSGANLSGANLSRALLIKAVVNLAGLTGANLNRTDLHEADLRLTDLSRANLRGAILQSADLSRANLREADLSGAVFHEANLSRADLTRAELSGAYFSETIFGDTNLTEAKGLESCIHSDPSTLDHRTLARSEKLPLAFFRGVGLPDRLIEYLPSLLGAAIQFYKCFISYSSRDQAFAERLHADLQNKGVRCWFAPHDLPIGAKTRPAIDEAIREYDKLLLVLSKHSVASAWVEHEIERALAKELRTRKVVLFPVRLDNAIMSAAPTWAREIREDRNIGDMRRWKNNHDVYQRTFERVLRDLRTENAAPAPRTEA